MKAHAPVMHLPVFSAEQTKALSKLVIPTQTSAFAKTLENANAKATEKPETKLADARPVAGKPPGKSLVKHLSEVAASPQIQTDLPTLEQIITALIANPQQMQVAIPQAPVVDDAPVAKISDAKATAAQQQVEAAPARETDAIVSQMVAVKAEPLPAVAQPALTPLEQAVHDMLSDLGEQHRKDDAPDLTTNATTQLAPTQNIQLPDAVPDLAPTAPIMRTPPQELVSQNHAHLVFDDPNGRIVMTVAVRGSEVNVSMRSENQATAAALARNAGTLDDSLRGRGLALATFDAQRDLAREQSSDKPKYERQESRTPVKTSDAEHFTLEEQP